MAGWPLQTAVIFGMTLAVASTVVLLRALEARGLTDTVHGHVAVGWLVALSRRLGPVPRSRSEQALTPTESGHEMALQPPLHPTMGPWG